MKKLNTAEAADFLGVKKSTLEVWRVYCKGPRYSKIGSRVMYDIKDLEAFFNSGRRDTADSSLYEDTNDD